MARSLIPSRRSHKIQLYPSCTQQSDRLKSLSTRRAAILEKIAPTCLPASVCTTNQSSPQRGLAGHAVRAGSRAPKVLREGELLSSVLPCPGRSAAGTKRSCPCSALRPRCSATELRDQAPGKEGGSRHISLLLDCFIKQSQSKQTQPHRRHTSSSFTHHSFSQLWENKEAEV